MALTLETGAAISSADSYVDTAYADSYLLGMGNASWGALTNAEKESALRMAARFLDAKGFAGSRTTYTQALSWPRNGATFENDFNIPSNAIPENIKRAQCEAAVRAAQGTLTADSAGGYVVEETVGGITRRYSDYSRSSGKAMKVVDDLLGPLLASSGSSHRVMRG